MGTSAVQTFSGDKLSPLRQGREAVLEAIALVAGTYAKGTVLGQVTATPGVYAAYASGNSDGSQYPTHLLEMACVVDGSGNVTLGDGGAGVSEWGVTYKTAPAYSGGDFACEDLTGLDATALTNGKWKLIRGTTTTGVLRIG